MNCLYCGYKIEGNETLDGDNSPGEGDISFCLNCGELSTFIGSELKKISIGDLEGEERTEVLKIRTAWLQVNAMEKIKTEKT